MTEENIEPDVERGTDTDTDIAPDIPDADAGDTAFDADSPAPLAGNKRLRTLAFVGLPVLIVLLGAGAGLLRWQDVSHRAIDTARTESVAAARDATVVILSYKADSVEQDLGAARDRLTGSFLESFTDLVNKVVIPGAREKKISAAAKVSAAASVSASAPAGRRNKLACPPAWSASACNWLAAVAGAQTQRCAPCHSTHWA